MKHFLKFTAIFALATFLFSSCNEPYVEGTSGGEAGDLVVGTSSIMDLRPGFNQFDLSFIVNSNESITSCIISWSGTDTGADTISVSPGGEYTFVSVDTLPAGDYTISLLNVCDDEDDFYTVAEERPVTVFDDSTYDGVTGILIDAIYFDGTDAEIVWGDTPDDCVGVVFTYVNNDADTVSTEILASSGSVYLTDASMTTTFDYVSYFAPDNAIDDHYVLIDNADATLTTIPYQSPEAPMTLSTRPGDTKLEVTWTVWDDSYLSQAIITCGETEYIIDVADMSTYTNASNVYTIEGLSAADYDITISHACVHDIDGTEVTVRSKELVVSGTEVYDKTVFEASVPKVWSMSYNTNTATATTYNLYTYFLQGAIDCEYVTLTYCSSITGGTLPTTISSFGRYVTTTSVVPASEYSYTATFALPTNALDGETMTVYGGEGVTPEYVEVVVE